MAAEVVFIAAVMMLGWSYVLYPVIVFTIASTRKTGSSNMQADTALNTKRNHDSAPALSLSLC